MTEELWSSKAGQIRTFSFYPIGNQSVLKTDGLGAILAVKREQHPVIVQKNGIYKNFDQRFPLFFLRNIELSKFHQPESDEILIETGLFQFFVCDFCSQLIFLDFQRFQTLFGCPGVQAVLDRLHQIVQLFVDLSQLLFQQRDRSVFLILHIHDQLNDLVDHRIVLNQLHGLPDDQIFQSVLLHSLFVAALMPLDVGAYLYFFSKCFTILRILARAVSFFCRSITLALLNFCVSSHLHCSVRLTQVEFSADTANTTGGSGNRAARCVRL